MWADRRFSYGSIIFAHCIEYELREHIVAGKCMPYAKYCSSVRDIWQYEASHVWQK